MHIAGHMFTIATYPYPECTLGKCKKSQHGYRVIEAIARSRSSDDLLARFVAKACRNFARVTDAGVIDLLTFTKEFKQCRNQLFNLQGSSALHAAAEHGRLAIAEWLLKQV